MKPEAEQTPLVRGKVAVTGDRGLTKVRNAFVTAAALAIALTGAIYFRSQRMQAQSADATALKEQESCKKTPLQEEGYYICPPGNYLGHTASDMEDRNSRLRLLHAKLRNMSYVHNDRELDSYKTRGFATYESSMWLKPKHCLKLIDEEWSKTNGYLKYKEDNSPEYMTKMVNAEYGMEFHLNWKVASTSFPSYLWCEYGTWTDVPKSTAVTPGYQVVAAVRHPVSRFVSSVGELLQRAVNYYCPSGYCTFEDDYWQGNVTLDKFAHQTSWYQLVQNGVNMTQLPEIMAAFVADTTCNYYTYASEHFITQTDFVTQNGGCAAPVNSIIQLEKLDLGLTQLADILSHTESNSCSLEDSNDADEKPGGVPTSGQMMEVLKHHDELMKQICYMYAQDFICFDYELPEECEGLF